MNWIQSDCEEKCLEDEVVGWGNEISLFPPSNVLSMCQSAGKMFLKALLSSVWARKILHTEYIEFPSSLRA